MATVNKYKEEIKELKSILQPLQRTFKTVVLGERRALEADLAEARRTIATLKHQEREVVNRRGHRAIATLASSPRRTTSS